MDFSSLVIMEKEASTGFLTKEVGSYAVHEGSEYITRLYKENNEVVIYFDTNKDLEEWEFSAVYDLFPYEIFEKEDIEIKDKDDEFNPTWTLKIGYEDKHEDMKEKLNHICNLVNEAMDKVFEDIKGKEADYI